MVGAPHHMSSDVLAGRRGGSLKAPVGGGGSLKAIVGGAVNKVRSSGGSLKVPSSKGFDAAALRTSRSGGLTSREFISEVRDPIELANELRDKISESMELKLRLAVLETARKRLSAEVDAQRKEKAVQTARLLESEGREHALKEELGKTKENLMQANEEISEQKALIAELQTLLSTQKSDAEEQTSRILKAEANHQQLMVEVEVWRRDRRELSSQFVESETSRKRLQSIVEGHRKEKDELVAKLAKVENNCQQTLMDLESQRLERQEQTSHFVESENTRRKLSAQVESHRKEKEQLRVELNKVECARKTLQEQLERQRKEKAKQSVRLAEVEHSRQRLQKHIEVQEKKKEEHVARIAEVEAALKQACTGEAHVECQCLKEFDEQDPQEHIVESFEHIDSLTPSTEERNNLVLEPDLESVEGEKMCGREGEVSCSSMLAEVLKYWLNQLGHREQALSEARPTRRSADEDCTWIKGRSESMNASTSTDDLQSSHNSARLSRCETRADSEDVVNRISELEAVINELRWQLEAWRQPPRHQTKLPQCPALRNELPDRSLRYAIESVLHTACSSSRCAPLATAKVLHVRPIINDILWQNYQNSRESMRLQHMRTLSGSPTLILPEIPTALQGQFPWLTQSMDSSMNERLVFHGTTPDFVEQIAQRGFDERLAHLTGLFGAGVYFAEQSCKAFRYSGNGPVRCILLTRVLLGNPYFATGPMRSIRRPPMLDANDPQQGLYDSIVAEVGTPTGKLNSEMEHRVFVLFEGKQAYPELAVYFEVGT